MFELFFRPGVAYSRGEAVEPVPAAATIIGWRGGFRPPTR